MKTNKKSHRARKDLPLNQMELFGDALPAAAKPAPPPPKPVKRRAAAPAPPAVVLLDVRQAAARLGLSKSTLDKMRCRGVGPKFVKSTNHAVRYDPKDLDAWIEARRRQSTERAD